VPLGALLWATLTTVCGSEMDIFFARRALLLPSVVYLDTQKMQRQRLLAYLGKPSSFPPT